MLKITKQGLTIKIEHNEAIYKLPSEVFYTLHIHEEGDLDSNQIQQIRYHSQLFQAKEKALKSLKNPKTMYEVKTLLKDFPKEIIEEVITFLKQYHYIDDVAYMKWYHTSKYQYGKVRLSQTFKQKGIQFSLVESFLSHIEDSLAIENIAIKVLNSIKHSSVIETKQKIYLKLLRLGFESSLILQTIEKLDFHAIDEEKLMDQFFIKKYSKLKGNRYEKCQQFIKYAIAKGFDYGSAKEKCEDIYD